ncbi:MAG TPA: Spy/CpxP family protein refolding chaperone [Planctomycetota bacterium]|nr:Spy/CpxP family protein refolding chaperone [Planctomycetota bacterium]
MRSPVGLPLILSVVLILVIAGAAITHLKRSPEAVATRSDPGEVSRLEARIAHLEENAARIEKLEAEIERLQGLERGLPSPDAPSPVPEAKESALDGIPLEVAEGSSGRLEEWLDSCGMRRDLESFVARVYVESRNARRQEERDEAEAKQREMKELSEGPYGRYNYRVNSLARKLDLDERQKEFLFNLLTKGEERRREARREEKTSQDGVETTPEEMEQRMRQLASLEQQMRHEFDRDFLLSLSREQQEAYNNLPEHERGGEGGVKFLSLDGGDMKVFARTTEVMVAPPQVLEKVIHAGVAPAPK